MRSSVDGLATPYPLAALMPAFMQEDSFAVRLTTGLDDVIAPVISVLDCLDAYVDPLLAPSDFVTWLAGWVGAPLDDNWDDALRRREVLASAVLYRMRGTLEGLRAQGWTVPETQANFVWLRLGEPTLAFAAACEQHGVVVRPFPGEGVRVTVGETEANDIFLKVADGFRKEL